MAYNWAALRRINISMTEEFYAECRAYAAKNGINFSELVRRSLDGGKYKRVISADNSTGDRRVIISMTEDNYAAYKAHADQHGIPFSALVRRALKAEMKKGKK